MKIISWNINGLRSVHKKGFIDWLEKENPDILCLQEIKLQQSQTDFLPPLKNYFSFYSFAQKPGYSGTAIFSKIKPLTVDKSLGFVRFDNEGRFLELKFPEFTLFNLYMPHGGRGKEKLDYKLESYQYLLNRLHQPNLILVGDFNIAHTELDLARPKDNKNNIMFTPEEREQLDKLINLGLVDTFRCINGEGGNYTWWPYRLNARERNLGWRIDYCFTKGNITSKLQDAFILENTFGSDHCPVGIILN